MADILFDTNVVSAFRRPDRAPDVMRWAATVPAHRMWMSVMTLFEIDHGIAREDRRDPTFAAELQH